MIGDIQAVKRKLSKTDKIYYEVTVGGKKHSCWDKKAGQLAVGDTIDYETVIKGNFTNLIINTMPFSKTAEGSPTQEQYPPVAVYDPPPSDPPPSTPTPYIYELGDRRLALKMVVELLTHNNIRYDKAPAMLVQLEVYLKTGETDQALWEICKGKLG